MKNEMPLRVTLLYGLVSILFLFNDVSVVAAKKTTTAPINPHAFVYILNMGIDGNTIQYKGLRNGFAIGNGKFILTAAHCLQDFEHSNDILRHPMIISPYYGDIYEAAIVAVDDKNDIAILNPNWDVHPALELDTSATWNKSKTITITGYPPEPPCRGGNGAISSQLVSEEVPLQNVNGKGRYAIQVGPVQYPGKGWSGSPFINPETGNVVSILSNEKYIKKYFIMKQHHIFGSSLDAIRQLFIDNNLSCGTSQQALPGLNRQQQFEQILDALNTIMSQTDKQQRQILFKEMCRDLPESYLLHIITGWVLNPPDNESYFQKAVEIAPNSILAHTAYGHNLLVSAKYNQAAKKFQFVLDLDPNHLFASQGHLTSLAHTDPNAAQTRALEFTKHWPENPGFYFEYSRTLRAQQKYAEELPAIQKAVKLCDETPFLYQRHLADSLKENRKYQQAEQAYQTLLKTHECEHCWRAYASLLEKMGPDKSKQAKEANEKANSFKKVPAVISRKNATNKVDQDKSILSPQ